jgi:outer membrane protein assembly factor BamA
MARLARSDRSSYRSVLGQAELTPTVTRLAVEASPTFHVGPLGVQPIVRVGWGRRLPLQYRFQLGGADGFPGLHIGELRGNREAMAGAAITIPLKGVVVLVAEGATGRSASGGPLLDSHGWIGGARAGIGADTPIGPIRFDYGFASGGREARRVRLGRWF